MHKDIILTLPFFVTFFWAITLWIGVRNAGTPKTILAIFMTVAALLYASHAVYFSKDYKLYAIVDPIYTFANLSVFPLFYLYIKSLTKEEPISLKSLWILSPAVFFFIISAIIYIVVPKLELNQFIHNYLYKESNVVVFSGFVKLQIGVHTIERVVFAAMLFPCTYLSWKYIMEYEKKIKEFYSATENRSLGWTWNMLIATVGSSVFALILNVIGKSFFIDEVALIVLPSLFYSVLLYTIGYLGANQAFSITDYQEDLLADAIAKNANHEDPIKSKLYIDITNLLEKEQVFRKIDLRITYFSENLNTNRTYISSIINSEFNSSFCDLVNRYRVNYSKKLLLHHKQYILEYVSRESGFASVNSFLRAFKKEAGITPGQYRKQMQKGK